jgi:hypothetical protein
MLIKSPAVHRVRPLPPPRNGESGVTILLVAAAMVAIMSMAALSIDMLSLYLARAEAQRAADAAALAAARVISISGITGDPSNGTSSWAPICGVTGLATQVAQAVIQKNPIAGLSLPTASIQVNYSAGTGVPAPSCVTAGSAFGVNPVVTVQVTRSSLPTFFSRVWGRTGSNVSATATAEAFNPSNSASVGGLAMVPVQPRCVKPWIVPNKDPGNSPNAFVDNTTGAINNPGVLPSGSGVIGERFWLLADCTSPGSSCTLAGTPQANLASSSTHPGPPNLEYIPGAAVNSSVAVAANSSPECDAVGDSASKYAQAIAGCDQTTVYACGGPTQAVVDLGENPSGSSGDTFNGAKCLINQAVGPDTLDQTKFPFQLEAGSGNPLVAAGTTIVKQKDVITSSNSIVSLPIYDSTNNTITQAGPNNVTVVGFLQVFINGVDGNGNVDVTVLNVAGCSNDASNPPVLGTSPVPVRLITPP